MIAAYTLLVGAGASVVRAAVMGSLGVIAQRLGRGGAGLNTLMFAAVLVLTRAVPEGALAPAAVLVVTGETLRAVDEALIAAVDPRLVTVSGEAETRLTPEQAALLGGRTVLHTAAHARGG